MNQFEHFKKRGDEVYAIDLLGHGDAYKPTETEGYRLPELLQHFVNSINELEISNEVVLVGHSFGAYVILNCLSEINQKASKLVLVSPLLDTSQFPALLMNAVKRPKNSEKLMRMVPLQVLRKFVKADKVNSNGVGESLLEQVAVDYKRADPRITYLLQDIKPNHDLKISLPTLLVFGRKDNIIYPTDFQAFTKIFSDAQIEIFEDGGHTIHQTHADSLNEAISRFILEKFVRNQS